MYCFTFNITKKNTKEVCTYTYNSQANEWDEFKEYPRLVVLHEEQHWVFVSKRIDGA